MDGFARFEHLFLGREALAIERHVRTLETIAFHAGRYWPLEAALWDLVGQARGEPVARVLGAAEMRLPVYASLGGEKTPDAAAEAALALHEEGIRALKLRLHAKRLREGVAAVAAVRRAVGASMEIAVDLNQGWRMPGDVSPALDYATVLGLARELRALEVVWLEEPLPAEDVKGLSALRAEAGLRIAGGEMARTVAELDAYLDADALDVYQPDAVLAVGIHRGLAVAERALALGRWFTPHTWTNGIGLLANLHLAAGAGAGPFLELPYDPPSWTPARRDFMLAEPLEPDADGCLAVPAAPGLGVVLDEAALRHYAVE